MFFGELAMLFRQSCESRLPAMIEVIKNNWLLFNSRSRDIFILKFQGELEFDKYHSEKFLGMLKEFIIWANQNRDGKPTTAKPLNNYIELPVVDTKPFTK